MAQDSVARIQLIFADEGTFHSVTVSLPADRVEEYDRLVDLLREEPSVTRQLYVDMKRLVSASIVEDRVFRLIAKLQQNRLGSLPGPPASSGRSSRDQRRAVSPLDVQMEKIGLPSRIEKPHE